MGRKVGRHRLGSLLRNNGELQVPSASLRSGMTHLLMTNEHRL